MMVTIISGTNRAKNQTLRVANYYAKCLKSNGVDCQVLDLSDLPEDFVFSALYGKQNADFSTVLEQYVYNVDKMVVVSPEYNGSYPGILKAFIDGWDPRKLGYKRVALVGVASGRAGNNRGMDHLTNVLNYLKLEVVPIKLPISQIFNYINEEGDIDSEEINKTIEAQIAML